VQEDLVNLLEEMSGPRGIVSAVRVKLEQLHAAQNGGAPTAERQ
jgi:hypothetical protein